MSVTTVSPFEAAIATAEEQQDRLREEQEIQSRLKMEKRETLKRLAADQEHLQNLRMFGVKFCAAVVKRVVKTSWSPDYIRRIQEYTEGMLRVAAVQDSGTPLPLTKIAEYHAVQIQDTFAYGLTLIASRGIEIPDGFFVGQQILAARGAETSTKPERLVIRPGNGPDCRSELRYTSSSPEVDDLPSATTPKGGHS